ncbi:Putative zinc ribbon domain protein [Candidatus Rubidus massiliensis]|nr:MAG: hypothetical protein BGO10_09300 [Chlamydia sp. 32-24]CDZ80498.1 Putative zinc ribbon domain protein [Candidatus Rubidus massiliensis]
MLKSLTTILDIQELDMQMIQLMRLKQSRQKELFDINAIKADLQKKSSVKEEEIITLKKEIRLVEGEIAEIQAKLKKLEGQQHSVKKVEEFNALTQEMNQVDKERMAKEQKASDLYDQIAVEEDVLKGIQQTLESTSVNSKVLEEEIVEAIKQINEEGQLLKVKRDELVNDADPEVFKVYERLLKNKRDRVVVPIENRCCSGCHIMLTAQDENLVRKGERIIFCEHCSRIHYWPESETLEGTVAAPKQRRRRTTKV